MNSLIIFTDGAVPNNQIIGNRKGGVGVFFGPDDSRNISFGMKETLSNKVTNQVCELLACVMALELIDSNNPTDPINHKTIMILTDSMYIINSMEKWAKNWEKNNWKKTNNKPIQNEILIKKLYYLTLKLKVNYKHVKAHTISPKTDSDKYFEWFGNYMADKLAVKASKI